MSDGGIWRFVSNRGIEPDGIDSRACARRNGNPSPQLRKRLPAYRRRSVRKQPKMRGPRRQTSSPPPSAGAASTATDLHVHGSAVGGNQVPSLRRQVAAHLRTAIGFATQIRCVLPPPPTKTARRSTGTALAYTSCCSEQLGRRMVGELKERRRFAPRGGRVHSHQIHSIAGCFVAIRASLTSRWCRPRLQEKWPMVPTAFHLPRQRIGIE